MGLSAIPLALLLPAEYAHSLVRPLLAFVVLGVAPIVGSWLWDHRGRLLRRQGDGESDRGG